MDEKKTLEELETLSPKELGTLLLIEIKNPPFIKNNLIENVRRLIEAGADLETRAQDNKCTPILLAAQKGMYEISRLLIEAGSDIEAKDFHGRTPLIVSFSPEYQYGYTDVTRLLIESGANIDASSKSGWTALHYAALAGGMRTVRFLIENGADINFVDEAGRTPWDIAQGDAKLYVKELNPHETI